VAPARPGGTGGALRYPTGTAREGCVAAGPANGPGRSCGLGKRKERSGPLGCAGKKRMGSWPGHIGETKWPGKRDSAHEAIGGLKNPFIFLGFDSNLNSNKFYTNPNTKHSINSK
jgi:hypothetical protein